MAKHMFVLVICISLYFTVAQGLQMVDGRIKITIGTTAGCTDTVRFMANLDRVYNLYGKFLDIEFIPWGRTINTEDGMSCQFGPNDCWANRHHRCALDRLKGNQDGQMHYMNCEFASPLGPSILQGSYICSHDVGLNLVDIDYCVNNPNQDELDLEAERRGSELTRAINEIPSIVFNDEIDINQHTQSWTRLESMICFALAADPTTGVTNCSVV